MPHVFNRTLRALDSDQARVSSALQVCGLLAISAWFVWFFGARVHVLAHSDRARLEVAQTGHRVQSAISGYVAEVVVKLGQRVQQGDVLARLDASGPKQKLEQRNTEGAGLRAQLAAVQRELAAASGALDSEQRAAELRLQEADARHAQAAALASVRDEERMRSEELLRAGVVPEASALRTRSDADLQRREEQALALARRRLSADQQLARAERAQHLAQLATRATSLQGQLAELDVSLRELEAAVALCTLRSPIAGRVGDLAAWTRGAFVQPGELIAVVVPEGNMRVVAQFAPDQALGRIQAGQRAQLKLTGFPFTQFGAVHGAVASVAKEAHEGTIRVELTLDRAAPQIPLQHALPGSLQVEIDRVSPATLAWRAVGRGLSTQAVSSP